MIVQFQTHTSGQSWVHIQPEAVFFFENNCFGRIVLCCFVFLLCCVALPFFPSISWMIKSCTAHTSFQIGTPRENGQAERFKKAPGTRYDFKFSRTFDEKATQSEIFDTVARKIVDRFIEGYNGTVFAYGQTSTGKTYTVEGSARQYDERGLVPR